MFSGQPGWEQHGERSYQHHYRLHGLGDFHPDYSSHNVARNPFKFSIDIEHRQDSPVAGDNSSVLRTVEGAERIGSDGPMGRNVPYVLTDLPRSPHGWIGRGATDVKQDSAI